MSLPPNPTAFDKKSLVFVSRLSKEERAQSSRVADAFPEFPLRSVYAGACTNVIADRLILAEEFLRVSERLAAPPVDEGAVRVAVGRAYYAVHHALRSMLLAIHGYEFDGHEAAIKALDEALKDADFLRRTGFTDVIRTDVAVARDNRCVADYSPYDLSRRDGKTDWIPITGNSWTAAAAFNIDVARKMIAAAKKYVDIGS